MIGCGLLGAAAAASAVDYVWSVTPVDNDWNLVSNWVPNNSAPNTVADRGIFGTSNITAITSSNGAVTGAIVFNVGASAYTITASPGLPIIVGGAGIANNSAATQTFVVASGTGNLDNRLILFNNATITGANVVINAQGSSLLANSAGAVQFANTASAGTASIFNLSATAAGGVGGGTGFFANSTAGTATITNAANSAGSNSEGVGSTFFSDSSSAGSASIDNVAAVLANGYSGTTIFQDTAEGGSAVIRNRGSTVLGLGGVTIFTDSANGGLAQIFNEAGISNANLANGSTQINSGSSLGSATVTNEGSAQAATQGGLLNFSGTATGGSATIINRGSGAVNGFGGQTQFKGTSTAGGAAIQIQGGAVPGALGGTTLFTETSTAGSSTITASGAALTGAGGGQLSFINSSQAGTATIFVNGSTVANAANGGATFADTSSAGGSMITVNGTSDAAGLGGKLIFTQTATAGNATITNNAASVAGFLAQIAGDTQFQNQSTAGNATINVNGGAVTGVSRSASTTFIGTSNAGTATINVRGATVISAAGGFLAFRENTSARNATINITGPTVASSSGGQAGFEGNATADQAVITTGGSVIAGSNGGFLSFYGSAKAGSATLINNASASSSGGAQVVFSQNASAENATITNHAGAALSTNAATITFNNTATAANATITNKGGASQFDFGGGTTTFSDTATAASATILNEGGTASGGHGGMLQFNNASSANGTTITTNGGTVAGALGGVVQVAATNLGAATFQVNGGSGGGEGGFIGLIANTNVGNSTFTLTGNSTIDISLHSAPGVSLYSLQGSGNVFLGSRNLTLGANGGNTSFTGSIQDGGTTFATVGTVGTGTGTGGSLTKIGAGTLTLSGMHTYTGATAVSVGTLRLNGSLDAASSVTVASGATLAGTGTANGVVTISNGATLAPGNSPGTITVGGLLLNNTSILNYELSTPGVVGGGVNDLTVVNGNFTLDGVINITDFGGFAAGTYRLFNYTGLLTDNTLTIGTLPGGFNASDFTIQTSIAGQVNLTIALTGAQYWDGPFTTSNSVVDGGTAIWNTTSTNWTNDTGAANNTWQGGIAVFASNLGTVTLGDNITTTGLRYEAGSGSYNIQTDTRTLTINGAVTNLSGNAQTLTAQAGGQIRFINTGNAGNALITALNSGRVYFENTSNAGTSTISVNTGVVTFQDSATAGSSTIVNNASAIAGQVGGVTEFRNTSTAGSTTITANGSSQVGPGNPGARVEFFDSATAGSATVTANGASGSGGVGGRIVFNNSATAATATYSNLGSTVALGGGGATEFNQTSQGAQATFHNYGGTVSSASGGETGFYGSSLANTATITNHGSTVAGAEGGRTRLGGTANAESAQIESLGAGIAGGAGGRVLIEANASAGNAKITAQGSTLAGAEGALTRLEGDANAAAGELIANGGTNAGGGGRIAFGGNSLGGTSRVEVNGNGQLDISEHAATGVAIGSLEGSGNAFLGANTLTVGTNNLTKVFSGVMQDGGAGGGVGGGFTKTGTGIFTLSGANLYTGATTVNAGTLRVNGSLAAASSVMVNNNATLGGTGIINGSATIANGGHLAPGNSAGTLTMGTLVLNSGSILDYELATPGIVGGGVNDLAEVTGTLTLDGTINVTALPGFTIGTYRIINYSGLLTDNTLNIGILPGGYTATVDTSIANQVNLIIDGGGPLPVAYWNGSTTVPNGVVNGGSGTWDNTSLNWTDESGTVAGVWGNEVAVFSGAPGTVTLATNISFNALDFSTNGYVIHTLNGSSLAPIGDAAINTAEGVSAEIAAPITGSGGISKNGAGKLTLTAANTYTGSTLVNAGSLIVDGSLASPNVLVRSGALLGGRGSLLGSVFNSGVMSPGNSPGILQVGGDYAQDKTGTLRIEVGGKKSGQFDLLAVGGKASLDGTLQLVRLSKFKLRRGDKITFLTAGQGVEGEFASVSSEFENSTILQPEVVYEDKAVSLELVRGSFEAYANWRGLTPNQRAVARALDSVSADDIDHAALVYLDDRSLNHLPGDFDKIAPEELTSIFTISTSLSQVQGTNLQRRTDDIRSGANGFSAAGLAINGQTPSFSGGIEFRTGMAGPSGDEGKESKEVKTVLEEEKRWGAFFSGTGEWIDVDGDGNARGFDITTGGFTVGLDYKVAPNFALGIAAGYTGTSADLADDGRVWVNGGKLGLYGTYFTGGFYVDAAVTGGYNSYDTKRSGLEGAARGSTEGGEINALAAIGYDWKVGALTLGPTATFNYTLAGMDGYTEHGSLAPLDIDDRNAESVRSAFGFRASYEWKLGGVILKPELRAAWQHEYGDKTHDLSASFANGAGDRFMVSGPELGRDSLLVGAGVAVLFNDRTSAYLYYDGELFRDRYERHSVTAGLRVAF